MTKSVITCSPSDSIAHLMAVMTQRRVRHLPVVDRGRLCGIISIGDVVKNRLEDLELETRFFATCTSPATDFTRGRRPAAPAP